MPTTVTPSCWRDLEEQRSTILRFLARRCRDEHEAEDLAQETLLRAARYRDGGGKDGRLKSWLVQIAANVLRDHARREGRGPRSGNEDGWAELIIDSHPGPGEQGLDGEICLGEHQVEAEDAMRYLRGAFALLLERDRAVLRAYYGAGESTEAAASECQVTSPLVKVRLFRARRRLERLILQRASQRRSSRLLLTA